MLPCNLHCLTPSASLLTPGHTIALKKMRITRTPIVRSCGSCGLGCFCCYRQWQTSVLFHRLLLPRVTKMGVTLVTCSRWALPYVKRFIQTVLSDRQTRPFRELGPSRGKEVSEKFSKWPGSQEEWAGEGRLRSQQASSSCSQKITRTRMVPHLRSGLLDFPDEFRQFYCRDSCPCYLYWKSHQISHPWSVLYFFYWESICIQSPVVTRRFVTHLEGLHSGLSVSNHCLLQVLSHNTFYENMLQKTWKNSSAHICLPPPNVILLILCHIWLTQQSIFLFFFLSHRKVHCRNRDTSALKCFIQHPSPKNKERFRHDHIIIVIRPEQLNCM